MRSLGGSTRGLLTPLVLVGALAWSSMWPGAALASPFSVPKIQPLQAAERDEDPTVAEAKSEYEQGSNDYALGKYEEAVAHFERAYELSHEPALLFNLGQAYTRWYDLSNDVEHLKKARRLYENYVLNVDNTSLDEAGRADARADAQRRIAEVDRRITAHEEAVNGGEGTDKPRKPVHKKAWFWLALVGGVAVVAAGVTTGVVLGTRDRGFTPELGTIGGYAPGGGLTLRF